MNAFTLIVPYYNQPQMLAEQALEWVQYPDVVRVIVVDDGSEVPAFPVLREAKAVLGERLRLYRIGVDIPWNRGGARNLASREAETGWIVHVDIDHVLPAGCAEALVREPLTERCWYRFHRFRRGTADDTRRKDQIPPDQEFGQIHPHGDSYLCTKKLYWKVGGYDEDYSGCLGGGSPFLKQMEKAAPVRLLSQNVFLVVYTRSVVADSSESRLSRDTSEYSRRRKDKERRGNTRAVNPVRFPWERLL